MATQTKRAAKTSEPAAVLSDYQQIKIGDLYPSQTNPRKRFPEASINELAGSIRDQGVLEPLIVRKRENTVLPSEVYYEIVCGERRYRASKVAGLNTVPCLVRNLTDAEVLDIQIHENLHREDVHPIDEAIGYQFLLDSLGCDVKEVAVRVGKSESFVHNRLKLNSLIPEIKADLESDILPVTYALNISRFPADIQPFIHTECFDSVWDSESNKQIRDKTLLRPWRNVQAFIETNLTRELSKAPFDRKATDLRDDGLACVKCTERTGASRSLFPTEETGKRDKCLNALCWESKMVKLIENRRSQIASETGVQPSSVLLIAPDKWWGGDVQKDDPLTPFLNRYHFKILEAKTKKPCKNAEKAISIEPSSFGKIFNICAASRDCIKHFPNTSPSSTGSSSTDNNEIIREKELDLKRQRREELFDCRVAEIVRKQVLRIAAESFADTVSITGHGPDTFLAETITKIMLTSNNDIDGQTSVRVVLPILRRVMDEPEFMNGNSYYRPYGSSDSETRTFAAVSQLPERMQKMMFFLCVHGNKGQTYNERWRSQVEVEALAQYYEIDYRLIDAKARLQVCEEKAKKHVEKFKLYLAAVESGADAEVPRIWSENWNPAK